MFPWDYICLGLGQNRCLFLSFFFLKTYLFIYLFIERGEGREKERERNIDVWLPLAHPSLGTWPTTQACSLTGDWTSDPLVLRLALNSLSHTSQQNRCFFQSDKSTSQAFTGLRWLYTPLFSMVQHIPCTPQQSKTGGEEGRVWISLVEQNAMVPWSGKSCSFLMKQTASCFPSY